MKRNVQKKGDFIIEKQDIQNAGSKYLPCISNSAIRRSWMINVNDSYIVKQAKFHMVKMEQDALNIILSS